MANERIYDWATGEGSSATCEVGDMFIYAAALPNTDAAVWFIRREGKVFASGICDLLSDAQANAEQTVKESMQPDLHFYEDV